jgi:hypothetical protein
MKNNVILLGLNELNLDFIKHYCQIGHLPNFKKILTYGYKETESEQEYHLLEPWIQWVTIYTGKTYAEHQVFRLGDITERQDLSQIFEELEAENYSVGAISPFNAANRLKNSPFFVPDPWTDTTVSGPAIIQKLSKAISQLVNDNAQSKVSISSLMALLQGMIGYISPSRYLHYAKLAKNVRKPGIRAVILDNLLADVFMTLWKKNQPDFSYLFLNAGAHIQHHYLYNSSAYTGNIKNPEWYCAQGYDPLEAVLKEYDRMLGRILDLNVKVLIATGLHQVPHVHLTYYWRLLNHKEFLSRLGIKAYKSVQPRMSRDFLVEFDTESSCKAAEKVLISLKMQEDGEPVFSADNRGKSLFMELIYPNDISETMTVTNGTNITIDHFRKTVAFVAIKNGEHHGTGYLLSNEPLAAETIQLKEVYHILKNMVKPV